MVTIIIILISMLCFLPLAALGAYMWITGNGQWAITGYGVMNEFQRAYYDTERMVKDLGKVLVIIGLVCLFGICTLYLEKGVLIYTVLVITTAVGVIAYLGRGKRYLKDPMRSPPPMSKEERKIIWAYIGVSIFMTAVILVIFLFIWN
jgi:hypothetical protein